MTRSMSVPCQMPSHTKADLCSPLETHVCTRRKATFLPAFPSVFYGRHLFFLFCFAYTKAKDSSPHTSSGLLFSLLSVKYLKLNATFLVFHSSSLPLLTLSFSSSLKLQKRQSIYIFSLNRFPFETESQSNLLSLDPSGLRQAGRWDPPSGFLVFLEELFLHHPLWFSSVQHTCLTHIPPYITSPNFVLKVALIEYSL